MLNSKPSNINDAQWEAISHDKGHLLIIAGPGTGKTHTLTHRIFKLSNQLNSHQKILAITFTKKAASEMMQRQEQLNENANQKVVIGTFHQFCLNLLKQYDSVADVPRGFSLATSEQIDEVVHLLWPDLSSKERRDLLMSFSRWKSILNSELNEDFAKLQGELRARGWLDFDDLLKETVVFLNDFPEEAKKVRRVYQFVCVDEYQDINEVQQELLKYLVKDGVHLTAIGDPNQAIYGFRGSEVKFFNSFLEHFNPGEIKYLHQNYRSTDFILSASHQIIAKQSANVPPLMAQFYSEGKLVIYQAPTARAEAEYVVHQIERLIGGSSMFSYDSARVTNQDECQYSFGDIAILYRMNAQRHALEEALMRSGLPFGYAGEKRVEEDPFTINAEQISLLTLHASKGLEFAVVFIVGCEEDLLPLTIKDEPANLEEERRLFYVGLTRAKKELFLTSSQKRSLFGKRLSGQPSPFLIDIEQDLKLHDQVKQKIKRIKDIDNQMELRF